MKDSIRARLADVVEILADLDAQLEAAADHLAPLILAKTLVRLEGIGARLASVRQTVADAISGPADRLDHGTPQDAISGGSG